MIEINREAVRSLSVNFRHLGLLSGERIVKENLIEKERMEISNIHIQENQFIDYSSPSMFNLIKDKSYNGDDHYKYRSIPVLGRIKVNLNFLYNNL